MSKRNRKSQAPAASAVSDAVSAPSSVVEQPSAPSVVAEAAPKAKPAYVYDRDAINAQIAAEKERGVVRLHPNKARYVKAVSSSADQRAVFDNGDEVATMLRAVSLDEVWAEAEKHLTPEVLAAKRVKYAGKNVGMVRMNLGNLIRGAIRAKARAATLAKAAEVAAQPKLEAQQ